MSVSSPLALVQRERVPRKDDPKRIIWSGMVEGGVCWSRWRRSATVAGRVFERSLLMKTEAVAWAMAHDKVVQVISKARMLCKTVVIVAH